MNDRRRFAWACATCLALATAATAAATRSTDPADGGKDAKDAETRPKIQLRAAPMISMAPSRVVLTAELVGGADDYEEFYCPTIEWDWGDGTVSEKTFDCEPYVAGKTSIRRRFSVEHVFHAGNWRVFFRLKRKDKAVATANANIQVRPGLRDIGGL
jgi:hypothetical protein